MRALDAPIRVITPGRCFRYEAVDASHGFEFFQVEGLVVDRDTSLADLKGLLEEVARALYGRDVRTRFRPGYYPFTEPSVAFDIGCLVCGGEGCPACKRSGWMTILGAGMVHPTVIRNGGFDPDEYQGYAFGMGPDRMTMLRHGIGDIRLFFSADLRFVDPVRGGPLACASRSRGCASTSTFDLSPRELAEELTMRGMEVSAIETAGARLDRCRRRAGARGRPPSECRHAVADARRRGDRPAASSRSCAARRTWRSASSCRRRWSGPCCPATGASSARRSAAR